ncbi:MAG: efflux RND transporter periplasmic adaptor subunit [Marinilabiliaceae bacterium]
MKTSKIAILALLPLTVLSFGRCTGDRHEEGHDHHHEAEETHEKLGPDDIHFTDAQAKAAGLTIDTARRNADFAPTLSCGGAIEATATGSATIVAPVSGVVSIFDTGLAPGAFLGKGKAVATISGKAVQDGDAAAKAKYEYMAAKKDYDRQASLAADKIVSQRELEDAKLRLAKAHAAYEAVAERMTEGGVAVTSPVAGHVTSVVVEHGQYVTAGQALATVERCGSKRLRVDVPERHFGLLRRVVSANFTTSASDSVFRLADMDGRLVSAGVAVEGGSAYIPVTFDFTDQGEVLPAGAAAKAYLILKPEGKAGALTVSNSSLIESQGLKFVYVRDKEDGDIYHRREVSTGQTDGIRTEVKAGVAEGDLVVAEGARRLHLAGASKSIPAHTHSH